MYNDIHGTIFLYVRCLIAKNIRKKIALQLEAKVHPVHMVCACLGVTCKLKQKHINWYEVIACT